MFTPTLLPAGVLLASSSSGVVNLTMFHVSKKIHFLSEVSLDTLVKNGFSLEYIFHFWPIMSYASA